jgi:hypothetical protein
MKALLTAMILASLIGTYLDLYFVGIGMYSFTVRPWADIFSVNILFTLIGLPFFMLIFLAISECLQRWYRAGFILLVSLIMAVGEKFAETLGLMTHVEAWRHSYTFIGYLIFLSIIYTFYKIMKDS